MACDEADRRDQAAEAISPELAAEIGSYISENKTRTAVKRAKKIHARVGTSESESLLVEAYAARIKAMRTGGLSTEAEELKALVARRFPTAWNRLASVPAAPGVHGDDLGAIVRPLADADLSSERREQIEDVIRRQVTDLSALADCNVLPDDHPLRRGAAALAQAVAAVTSGPVDDGDIALSEIPRRSPLAPWKLLVRAIACFYRHDETACARCLDAMDARSAAYGLAPAMRTMMGLPHDGRLSAASEALVSQVADPRNPQLNQALEALEHALGSRRTGKIVGPIRRAIGACRKVRPDLLDRLKQHISIRSLLADVPVDAVVSALGGPSLHDACFWRLYARAVEIHGMPTQACALWAEFLRNAVNEGWFAETSVEAATVYLRMAELLRRLPAEMLAESQGRYQIEYAGMDDYYQGQPSRIRAAAPGPGRADLYFLYPERLYQRACGSDPEAYGDWLAYAKGVNGDPRLADDVAEQWRKASPSDVRPLLHLARSAEDRKAFTKALKHLDRAEALDALNPSVRRAQLRLWTRKALVHLKEGKAHLAAKDFARIEDMPMSRDGDRPAFFAAMRWINADQSDDAEAAEAQRGQVDDLMGGRFDGAVLINCIRAARSGRKAHPWSGRPDLDRPPLPEGGNLSRAVAHACAVGADLEVEMDFPWYWRERMLDQMPDTASEIPLPHLRALGETACLHNEMKLCYKVSELGLDKGPEHQAWSLFLRARCLPYWGFDDRREECLEVAGELARQRRDMDLVAEIVDAQRRMAGPTVAVLPPAKLCDDEEIAAVLKREREAKGTRTQPFGAAFLSSRWYDEPRSSPFETGGRESMPVPPLFAGMLDDEYEDYDEDYDDDALEYPDESDDGPSIGLGLPPELEGMPSSVIETLLALAAETGGRPPTEADVERLFRKRPELLTEAMEDMWDEMADDPSRPPDVLDFFRGGPVKNVSRKERRRKRKKDRKNRRR